MYKKLFLVLLAFSFALAINAQTADEVIEKSIKAYGGADSFDKVTTTYMESVMKIKMAGMEMPMKTWSRVSSGKTNQIRLETEAMGQKMIMGFDGNKYWMNMGGANQEVPENMIGQVKSQLTQSAGNTLHPLYAYKKAGLTAELIGKMDIDGKSLYKIKVSKTKGESTFYYFDAISYFLYRIDITTNMDGQVMEVVSIIKEQQKVSGIIIPKVIESSVGGQVAAELIISKVEINKPIEDSMFSMPK